MDGSPNIKNFNAKTNKLRAVKCQVGQMKKIRAVTIALSFGLGFPTASLAEVPQKIHQRCLEARDYLGCVKAMRINPELKKKEFVGIGIRIFLDQETANLTVHSSIKGSPAAKSGIKSGDVILSIDGRSTKGMGLKEAIELIKGEEGSNIRIVFERMNDSGKRNKIKLRLKREKILISNQPVSLQPQFRQWIYKGFPDDFSPFFPKTDCKPTEENEDSLGLQT